MNLVYSTLTANNCYAVYGDSPSAIKTIKKQVVIKGGSNVANKQLITPLGVSTEVSDEDLDFLEKNYSFKEHVKEGFIVIVRRKGKEKVLSKDKVMSGMKMQDGSAPIIPNDERLVAKPWKQDM